MSHPETWNNLSWFRVRSSSATEVVDLHVVFSLIMSFSRGVSPIVRTVRIMNLQFCLHWKLSLVRLPLCSSLIPCLQHHEGKDSAVPPCLPLSPTAVSVCQHRLSDLCVYPWLQGLIDSFLFITSNVFHSTNVIYSLSDQYCLTQKHILEKVLKYIRIQKFYWHPGRKIRTTHEFLSVNTECQKILEQ